jgi:type I restriction enzyme, S subunit
MRESLPAGWKRRKLGDLASECSKRNSGEFTEKDVFGVFKEHGLIPMRDRVMAASIGRYKVVDPNDFAYNPMRLNIGSIARSLAAKPVLVSPDYEVFRCIPDKALPEWLDHVRRGPDWTRFVESAGNGSVRVRIYFKDLAHLDIPVPPVPEQKKIAAILTAVDDVIQKTQAVIDQLQVVKQAMMEELLTRGLPGRHKRFKKTEVGEIPEEWDAVALDDCIVESRPICYGILMPGKAVPGGVPVVKVKDIRHGLVDESDLLLTSQEIDRQYSRSRLTAGDLLMTIRGTTGRVAMVPPALSGANITQDTARISIRHDLSNRYVYHALQAPAMQRQVRDHTRGQAVKGINIGDVRLLKIPLPPKSEQEVLAELFDANFAYERALVRCLQGSMLCKKALSHVLLSGEIRVSAVAVVP